MKITILTVAALMLAAGAQGKQESGRQVTVYLRDNATVPDPVKVQAEGLASSMFADIGVTLHWRLGNAPLSEPGAIAIELLTNTPDMLLPGALAYALPYEGVHIRIFWDRIGSDRTRTALLAHVMVHEITHILQGVARHSDEGVMKARWTAEDRANLACKPLRFTPLDIDMIHKGMEARGAVEIAAK